MKSYVVIGLGRFGKQVAMRLHESGADVLAIDTDVDAIDDIADFVTHAVVADATNKDVLHSLGAGSVDCAIIALGSDLGSSVLVTMNMKSLGVSEIICKAHDDTHREILEKLGATKVIIPEREEADRLAKALTSPNILEYIELSDEHEIVEITTPASWIGKTIRELNIRAKYGVNIIAVRDESGLQVSPSPDEPIQEKSAMVLLGSYKAVDQIRKL